MKKQFMRYRLVVDQKVGRANKSEVLSNELLQIEKHIEHVRVACQSTYKKMAHCMQTHGVGDYEKRLKRLSEHTLALAMNEASSTLLTEGDLYQSLGNTMDICAKAQSELAKEKAIYEMFVDDHVIGPLQALVETEIPVIQKQREKLKRLVLDRDGFYQNYMKASRAQQAPGAYQQQAATNVDALKEKYDQASMRMEQCKDQLVTEMFEFLSKEVGHGQRVADFHAKQLDYHRRCVKLLEKLEPEIQNMHEKTIVNTSFGRKLADHLKTSEREIASPIEACVLFILEYGLKEEGIFRIAGGASKVKKIRSLVDSGVLDLAAYEAQDDVHAVAGALKQYLRELPNPLLTHGLNDRWIALSNIQDNDQRLKEIQNIIADMPAENRVNFRYLVKFCSLIAEYQDYNKMSPSNLAVVLAPNLLWSNIDDIGKSMVHSNIITTQIETVFSNANIIFPEDIDFVVTPNATSYQLQLPEHVPAEPKSPPVTSNQPFPIAKLPKPVNHSHSSSGDMNGSYDFSNISTGSRPKKQKSKAPPPPQQQPPVKPDTAPPPIAAPPSKNNTLSKPPVAAKRTESVRKPNLPPPPNPNSVQIDRSNTGGNDQINPKARPRPQARKNPGHPGSLINPPPNFKIFDASTANATNSDENNSQPSPPLPAGPPPRLPLEVEMDLGASLSSELQFSNN